MTYDLTGKVAVVTGASKGIGAGIAKGLAKAGAALMLNYASDRAGAEAVAADIVADGGRARAIQTDVSRPEDVTRFYAEVANEWGRLDILVNNAGIYIAEPIGTTTVDQFDRLYGVNVLGLLLSTQSALPLFGGDGGSIVNISALAACMASPGMAAYAGSKGAVDSITLSLSKELGPRHIRVNSISPGSIQTPGLAESGFMSGAMKDRVLASTPAGRLGDPSDIADAVVFLASDAPRWINGQIICAAGGLTY